MEFIKQWTFCVCVSLIISVIFSILTPKGSMINLYKMALSLFVFVSFILPLSDFHASDFDFTKSGISDVLVTEQDETVESMINSEVKTLLNSKGVTGFSVSSNADYDVTTGEITVRDIQISVSDDEDVEYIKDLVFDNLGLKVRVIRVGS